MTYNFDAEGWYERQRMVIQERHRRGELDEAGVAAALAELERRYDEMLDRLDGSYQIPAGDGRE